MIKSMTGFGRSTYENEGREYLIEIKSVNHRYFELYSRVPRTYAFLEEKLKRLLSGAISRGKVDVGVMIQTVEGTNEEITINKEVAKSYIEALRSVKDEFDLADDLSLSVVAKFPDVFTVVKAQTDEDALWADVESVAKKAVAAFVEMAIEMGAIFCAWWYNNSFSEEALKAQEYLMALREEEYIV